MYWVILTLTSLLSLNNGLIYVPDAKPFKEAQEYCKRIYGTDLASIATSDDRNDAMSAINNLGFPDDQAWIGLYSDDTETNWRFLNNEPCPSDSHYKCVDFWLYRLKDNTNYRPRCIGPSENGYQCAYYDQHTIDGVDNNIPCTDSKPFFCDGELASTCSIEGSVLRDYPISNLEDNGWQICYDQDYSTGFGWPVGITVLQAACPTGPNTYLFFGAKENPSSENIYVGAYGPGTVLSQPTSDPNDRFTARIPAKFQSDPDYNVYWYNYVHDYGISANPRYISWSIGFAPNSVIWLNTADIEGVWWTGNSDEYRLSWHTHGGGWKAGDRPRWTPWRKIVYFKNCADEVTINTQGTPVIAESRRYYVISGIGPWADAQQACQDTYGTDLATIITEQDQSDAIYVLEKHGFDAAWIGLTDADNEGISIYIFTSNDDILSHIIHSGDWEWIDGTPCSRNDGSGLCSDLWDWDTNNLDDIDSDSNADCVQLNTDITGTTDDNDWDGSAHLELNCDSNNGVALCNV